MYDINILYIVVVIAVVEAVENVGKLIFTHNQYKISSFLPVDNVLEIVGNFCGFQHRKNPLNFPIFFNKFLLENFAVENSVSLIDFFA